MNKYLIPLIVLITFYGVINTSAVTKDQAADTGYVVGAFSGLASLTLVGANLKSMDNKGAMVGLTVAAGATVGCIVGRTIYKEMLKRSPEYSFFRAQKIFEKCMRNDIVSCEYMDENSFCVFANDYVGSFIHANDMLRGSEIKLKKALKLAKFANDKTFNNTELESIRNNSGALINSIESMLAKIIVKRKYIKENVAVESVYNTYKSVCAQFDTFQREYLVRWAIESPETVIKNVSLLYSGDWPLIYAQKDLKNIQMNLRWLVGHLTVAITKYNYVNDCLPILNDCNALITKIEKVLSSVENSLGVIAISSSYLTQVRSQQENGLGKINNQTQTNELKNELENNVGNTLENNKINNIKINNQKKPENKQENKTVVSAAPQNNNVKNEEKEKALENKKVVINQVIVNQNIGNNNSEDKTLLCQGFEGLKEDASLSKNETENEEEADNQKVDNQAANNKEKINNEISGNKVDNNMVENKVDNNIVQSNGLQNNNMLN